MDSPPTRHGQLLAWTHQVQQLCEAKAVHWCDGSEEEAQALFAIMQASGSCLKLCEKRYPNSYLFRSDPRDVARVEKRTFICSDTPEQAGPTNNWEDPQKMRERLQKLFKGCMRGRMLYVLPFCMGPLNSPFARLGVQLTDSAYVVVNTRIMAKVGQAVLEKLGDKGAFIPCLHSVGVPLKPQEKDQAWPCNPDNTCIAHFPKEKEIFSFGSGYGGNALLGKKCLALRLASVMGQEEGWMAEHMLILGIERPGKKKRYVAAAFPSACGKTNFAMMLPPQGLKGCKITCLGDDIAWLRAHEDGRLWALNPESGFFGVATGTSPDTNANALAACSRNAIFTNVAFTSEKTPWWEGLTSEVPQGLVNWKGEIHTGDEPAAHPNSRFTVSATQCPIADENMQSPLGVPIDAIIFGGRRAKNIPLVLEAFSWLSGVYLGATMGSEQTAAAEGVRGQIRHDPMAMLPFCGYHMGDYFAHWLKMGEKLASPPSIFHVNWFGKDSAGRFLWPGFGENARVLNWIIERVEGTAEGEKSPLGTLPTYESFNWDALAYPKDKWEAVTSLSRLALKQNLEDNGRFLSKFQAALPSSLQAEQQRLEKSLEAVAEL